MPAKRTTDGRTAEGKWVDRWWEDGVKRQRTFERKGDRDAFRRHRERVQQLGRSVAQELLLEDDLTLAAWMEEYWLRHAVPNLEAQTRATHKRQWAKWILPRLGTYALNELTPRVINTQLVAAMRKQGAGEPTITRTLAVLQSMLTLAVVEERIPRNPVALVAKPGDDVDHNVAPIPPATVERMRRLALARRGPLGIQDAFIISVIAYSGLRPQELLALEWEDVLFDLRKLFIHRKNVDGKIDTWTKSRRRARRRHRRVDLLDELGRDFREYRVASGRREGLVIARRDGAPWRKHDWDNWRERVWQPLAVAVGLGVLHDQGAGRPPLYEGPNPYDLRGAFVSLMVWEGRTMLEVSGLAGHGVDVCERHYARIFEGYDPAKRTSAEEAVRSARESQGRAKDALGATQEDSP